MARLIPASERISKARALIEQARQYPLPEDAGWGDFTYVARVKDLLRQARELVGFISYNPGLPPETKSEAANVVKEANQAEKEILHR